jgi:hypothetical protein
MESKVLANFEASQQLYPNVHGVTHLPSMAALGMSSGSSDPSTFPPTFGMPSGNMNRAIGGGNFHMSSPNNFYSSQTSQSSQGLMGTAPAANLANLANPHYNDYHFQQQHSRGKYIAV